MSACFGFSHVEVNFLCISRFAVCASICRVRVSCHDAGQFVMVQIILLCVGYFCHVWVYSVMVRANLLRTGQGARLLARVVAVHHKGTCSRWRYFTFSVNPPMIYIYMLRPFGLLTR